MITQLACDAAPRPLGAGYEGQQAGYRYPWTWAWSEPRTYSVAVSSSHFSWVSESHPASHADDDSSLLDPIDANCGMRCRRGGEALRHKYLREGTIKDNLTVTPLQVTSLELGCSNSVCQLKMMTSWSQFCMNPNGPYLGPLWTILLFLLYKSRHLSYDAQI